MSKALQLPLFSPLIFEKTHLQILQTHTPLYEGALYPCHQLRAQGTGALLLARMFGYQ